MRPQAEVGVSHARLLQASDRCIAWGESALAIHRRVMGLYPGAYTLLGPQRLRLLATAPLVRRLIAQLTPEAAALVDRWPSEGVEPGAVLAVEPDLGVVLATGGCPLLLRSAQLEGKAAAAGRSLVQQLEARSGGLQGFRLG